MPFASVNSRLAGRVNAFGVPSGGGCSRAGCWAPVRQSAIPSANALAARRPAWRMLILFSPLSAGAAGFRRDDELDRTILRSQILLGRALKQLRRDLSKPLLELVDTTRIVVEEGEGGQQIGPPEPRELLEL